MKHRLIVLAAGAAIVGFGQMAEGADLPQPPTALIAVPSSWTGPYLGVEAGYVFGSTSVTDAGVVTETNAPTNGGLIGLLAGYNWQFDDLWLAGVEGDVSLESVHGNGVVINPPPPPPAEPNSYDANWAANLRGRIGYLIAPDTLLFGAGGLALTDLRFTEGTVPTGVTRIGWTVGAGIEQKFSDSLVGRLEFLHSDYGNVTYGVPPDDYVIGFSDNTVRGALIWKY